MANKIYPANGLEIDFLGLPMIINDGQTENTLQVRLTNNNFFRSLDGTPTAIVLDQHTPVHIWFVVDVAQASAGGVRHWALTSFDAFHDARVALEVSTGQWEISREDSLAGNPLNDSLDGWKLIPKQPLTLAPRESLLLSLRKLTSDLPDGFAGCYCQVDLPVDEYQDSNGATKPIFLTRMIGPIIKSRTLITDDQITVKTDLVVNGMIRGVTGNLALESAAVGKIGPKLRLINAAGGKDSAAAIELSGYDTRKEEYGDTPAVRIAAEDDGSYSGHLIVSTKGPGPKAPLTERLRLSSKGDLTVSGGVDAKGSLAVGGGVDAKGNLTVGGALTAGTITAKGRVQDKAGDVMPVGTVVSFIGVNIPQGWLECVGQKCPYYTQAHKDQFGDLYRVLGEPPLFKDGNNNHHFSIPDLRSRFIVGAGSGSITDGAGHNLTTYALKSSGGAEFVTLSEGQMPPHRHLINGSNFWIHHRSFSGDDDDDRPFKTNGGDVDSKLGGTDYAGSGQGHENRPPYFALKYIIKY